MRNIVAVVQARTGSSRFPGKVMKIVAGRPLIEILIKRLSASKRINKIILATSHKKENDELVNHVEQLGIDVYRGSESDVLDRFYQVAIKYRLQSIVRITGDCPIIDPEVVDAVIEQYEITGVDYASNVEPPTWPDGLDVEVFSFVALSIAWNRAHNCFEREHVTHYIQNSNKFTKSNLTNKQDLSSERWTVDEPQDLEVIRNIVEHFSPSLCFSWKDVMELKSRHLDYFEANRGIQRNKGI